MFEGSSRSKSSRPPMPVLGGADAVVVEDGVLVRYGAADSEKTRGQLIAELRLLRERFSQQYFEHASELAKRNWAEQHAYVRLIQDMPVGIMVLDRRGCVVTWNRACERLFGWTAQEVHGRPVPTSPAEEWGAFERSLERELQLTGFAAVRRRLVGKAGEQIEAVVSSAPLHDGHGEVVGLVCVVRRAGEEATEASLGLGAGATKLGEAAEGLSVVDEEDRVVYANGVLARLLGVEVDDLRGCSLGSFVSDMDKSSWSRMLSRRRSGAVDRQELWLSPRSGARVRALVCSMPWTDEVGRYRGALEMVFDLSGGSRVEAGGEYGGVDAALQRAATQVMEGGLAATESSGDTTPALLYIVDVQSGRMVYANRRSELFFDASSDAIRKAGREFLAERLHPRHANCWDAGASRFAKADDGEVVECEVQVKNHAGLYRWLHCYEVVFSRTKEGQPAQVLGAAIDVTQQKSAQRSLAEREALYRLLTEHATDLISKQTLDGRYLYVSPSAKTLLGVDAGSMLGTSFFDRVHDDDKQLVADAYERVRTTATTEVFTCRRHHADGSWRWFESVLRAIADPHTGDFIELQCASRDVTERREAEQALRLVQTAVEQIEEAVLVTDADIQSPGPRIVYANPAFERITGYKAEEVVGHSPRMLQGKKTSRETLERVRRALERGETFHGEVVNYRKDGSPFDMFWHLSPLRERDGRITHWVAIQRDVTEEKRQERLLRQHESDLAHVSRLSTMGEMASGLAHELNQPLAAISNYMQGCLHRIAQPELDKRGIEEAMHQVARQAERAGQIIRRLRNFVDKREPTRANVDLNATIRDALALTEMTMKQGSAQLNLELDPTLPHIPLDSIQIEQVIVNIVRNAAEAMSEQEDEPRRLTVRSGRADGESALVTISDTGPGMTNDQLDHIFDPFFTTKGSGMGMGLNISQSIVQAHQGRLWASRNAQRGMTFHILLPMNEPA